MSEREDGTGILRLPRTKSGRRATQTDGARDVALSIASMQIVHDLDGTARNAGRDEESLAPAPLVGGNPDWDGDPDFASRLPPSFQCAITPEIVFFGFDLDPAHGRRHWVVLEEPPHGFQFFCRADTLNWEPARVSAFVNANNGAEFASAAFADPYRVLIRGSSLVPAGGP